MTERQKTFGDVVGMDSDVEVGKHPSDWVLCSDGTYRNEEDVFYDCRDNAHGSEEDRHTADVAIVTEILNNYVEWAEEYCTTNSDYPDSAIHCVSEVKNNWSIDDWVDAYDNNYVDLALELYNQGQLNFDIDEDDNLEPWELEEYLEHLISCHISRSDIVNYLEDTIDEHDCEAEYGGNEYMSYDGDGCCLWGFDIGEYEDQIDVNSVPELAELHDQLRLDDVLDDVTCDGYVSRSKRREKNPKTGYYEDVGRETYMPYDHNRKHPTFKIYSNPGGRWDFVVSHERMVELVSEALLSILEKVV